MTSTAGRTPRGNEREGVRRPDADGAAEVRVSPTAWSVAWRAVLAATATVVGIWLIIQVRGIVVEVLIALILATGLRPLVARLHRRGLPQGVAVLLIYVGFIVLVALLLLILVPPVVIQVESFVANAPEFGNRLTDNLIALANGLPFISISRHDLDTQLRQLAGQVGALVPQLTRVVQVAVSIFSGFLSVILTLLITFYLIVDGDRIRSYFLGFLAPRRRARAREVTDSIGQRMGGWLLGQLALSFVIGLCSYIALLLLGVKGALLLAVIAAIGEAVPIIGPIVTAVPAILVALTDSPFKALLVLVAYLIIQQLESNILAPNIMGKAVKLHPLAVLLALLIGGQLLGIVGAIISVPMAAALSVVVEEWRKDRRRRFGEAPVPAEGASD